MVPSISTSLVPPAASRACAKKRTDAISALLAALAAASERGEGEERLTDRCAAGVAAPVRAVVEAPESAGDLGQSLLDAGKGRLGPKGAVGCRAVGHRTAGGGVFGHVTEARPPDDAAAAPLFLAALLRAPATAGGEGPAGTRTVGVPIATINPATGETLETFEPHDDAEVERRVALADATFRTYRRTSFAERAQRLERAADLLDADEAALGATMTTEMGKPVSQARAEIRKCAGALRYYAENAERLLADEEVPGTAAKRRSFVTYQPMGPVLAVMPWNFPMWQVIRFAAPSLMLGNVGLLKHASNVPKTALYLDDLFARAGMPEGVFQTLLIGSGKVEALLRDDRITAATLTGSEGAGRAVAAVAGSEIKKTVLELGGSDPFIVMPSADLDRAVEVGVKARVQNNGQSCIAAKRFIVHEDIAEEYEERFAEAMAKLVVGDPLDDGTDVGPLATPPGRDEVAEQVEDAKAKGARILTGGERIDGPGWYYPPTVVAGVTKDMRVYREEVFGPVATFFRAADADEAIAIANDSTFGLGSNAWTEDEAEQKKFISEIEAGMVFINWMVTSYYDLPFGGVKRSGYGRELSGPGIKELAVTKTVWVD